MSAAGREIWRSRLLVRTITADETIDSVQRDASTVQQHAAPRIPSLRGRPMPNPIPVSCGQHHTTPSPIPPTVLWIGCGSCSGETIAMLGVDVATRELIGGQAADAAFENRNDVTLDECLAMVWGKTAALISASAVTGAVLAGARSPGREALRLRRSPWAGVSTGRRPARPYGGAHP